MRPRLLDLFCGAGGCSVGYHRAGFDVVGVDNEPQKRYPFLFIKADALEYLAKHGPKFDAIHASPPCQKFSSGRHMPGTRTDHQDLIQPTRKLLLAIGKPWVIENVIGSPLRPAVMLCGSMFGLKVRRHRLFETSVVMFEPGPCDHKRQQGTYPAGRSRNSKRANKSSVVMVYGGGGSRGSLALWSDAMGIDWMQQAELGQAIPPAYTEYIGRQLLQAIGAAP
jgi:DNA (cytosine-5)-methyltransferase 1